MSHERALNTVALGLTGLGAAYGAFGVVFCSSGSLHSFLDEGDCLDYLNQTTVDVWNQVRSLCETSNASETDFPLCGGHQFELIEAPSLQIRERWKKSAICGIVSTVQFVLSYWGFQRAWAVRKLLPPKTHGE